MPIFCTLSLNPANKTQKILLRVMKKFNRESFLDDIYVLSTETNNFIRCVEKFDLDESIDKFLNNLTRILSQHAPTLELPYFHYAKEGQVL